MEKLQYILGLNRERESLVAKADSKEMIEAVLATKEDRKLLVLPRPLVLLV